MASYVLFIGTADDLICAQATGALTATGGGTTYTPGSITFGGPVVPVHLGLAFAVREQGEDQGEAGTGYGIVGVGVDSVCRRELSSVAGSIGATIGTGASWVGRAVSVIGRQTGSTSVRQLHDYGVQLH